MTNHLSIEKRIRDNQRTLQLKTGGPGPQNKELTILSPIELEGLGEPMASGGEIVINNQPKSMKQS
jgi:hypothetical protein